MTTAPTTTPGVNDDGLEPLAVLHASDMEVVRQHTEELRVTYQSFTERQRAVRDLATRNAVDVWHMGGRLNDVRHLLGDAGFSRWLQQEFADWGRSSAYNFMRVHAIFSLEEVRAMADILGLRAMYLLSQASTPQSARAEVFQLLTDSEQESITFPQTRDIVARHRKEPEPGRSDARDDSASSSSDDGQRPTVQAEPAMPFSESEPESPTVTLTDMLPTTEYDRDEWCTPASLLDTVRAVLRGSIDCDPASNDAAQQIVQAGTYYTKDSDGLAHDWHGTVWLNPPYSLPLIEQFVAHAIAQYRAGRATSLVILTNNATETDWFQALGTAATSCCFLARRVRFWHPERPGEAPRQGQVIFYFGTEPERFITNFDPLGWIPGIRCTSEVSA